MPDYNRLNSILENQVKSGFVTGIHALVYCEDDELYYGQYGVRNLETKCPMNRDTIVRLYSMSKPITAVATMILVERGLLALEDPIEQYLPEYRYEVLRVINADGEIVPAAHSITISDLLHMTSGIPYPDYSFESGKQMAALFERLIKEREEGKIVTTRDYARGMAQIPLCFQPGEGWMYGPSADILGAIIEVVSDERYDRFLNREIFEPLGMKDTGFYVPQEKKERFAVGYTWNEELQPVPFMESFLGEYYEEDVAFHSGGAGLVSTVDDYMRFARMLANGGVLSGKDGDRTISKRILSEKTVRMMAEDHLTPIQRKDFLWDTMKGYGYGCLMRVLINRQEANSLSGIGEFGWDGWMGCYMFIDPTKHLCGVYMIQRAGVGTTEGAWAFRDEAYRLLEQKEVSSKQNLPE